MAIGCFCRKVWRYNCKIPNKSNRRVPPNHRINTVHSPRVSITVSRAQNRMTMCNRRRLNLMRATSIYWRVGYLVVKHRPSILRLIECIYWSLRMSGLIPVFQIMCVIFLIVLCCCRATSRRISPMPVLLSMSGGTNVDEMG